MNPLQVKVMHFFLLRIVLFFTHTHTHTHTDIHHGVVSVWPPARKIMTAVCKRCELLVREPAEISNGSRDARAMAGGVSGYPTKARLSGGGKRKG